MIIWGSPELGPLSDGPPETLFSDTMDGPEPAGVRGGDANAESLGLPWGEWKLEELGVGSLVESADSSSRDGTLLVLCQICVTQRFNRRQRIEMDLLWMGGEKRPRIGTYSYASLEEGDLAEIW